MAAKRTTKAELLARIDRIVDRTAGPNGCHYARLKTCQSNGYAYICIDGKNRLLHRVVYELAHDVKLRRDEPILHSPHCCSKRCVNPLHLHKGTLAENSGEAGAMGLLGQRKLDRAKAAAIRATHAEGQLSLNLIAVLFGTSPQNVQHVIANRTWAVTQAQN